MPCTEDRMTDCVQPYIDFLKKCVGNWIYDDDLILLSGEMAVDVKSGKCFAVSPEPATRTDMRRKWRSSRLTRR